MLLRIRYTAADADCIRWAWLDRRWAWLGRRYSVICD
jgi:hypothetical protein